MIKGIKKIVLLGLAFYILDKSIIPLSTLTYNPKVDNPKIQMVMQTENYLHIYDGNYEQNSLNYLKLAHAITMKYMDLDSPPFWTSFNESLDSKVGDCSETSSFFYSNYLYLIKAANKSELDKYVRMAFGEVDIGEDGGGHQWLEIFQNGSWVPYETTLNDLPSITKIEPDAIDRLVPTKYVLNPGRCKYIKTNTLQVHANGNVERNLSLQGVIHNKGFAYELIKAIFNNGRY